MRLYILVIFSLILCTPAFSQNKLSTQQAIWLYRITQKTPVLKRSWSPFFDFNTESFYNTSHNARGINYDALNTYYLAHPEALKIDYGSIAQSTPGLIAEASAILSMYELNTLLIVALGAPQPKDYEIYKHFEKQLNASIPAHIKKDKKRHEVLAVIINPSLPIKIKAAELEYLKLSAGEQRKALNKWRQVLHNYLSKRSKWFYSELTNSGEYYNLLLLAAGEGSGTAGLLYENETHPEDSTKQWYGRGIGLFTYDMKVGKDIAIPTEESRVSFSTNNHESRALHVSLWGLNSSHKPLVVITRNNKSYHLFSNVLSSELTPDRNAGEGLSYMDRIEQLKATKVDAILASTEGDNPLPKALKKEYETLDEIELKLTLLEAEIDTLRKAEEPSKTAIANRKTLIDSHLTNLSAKNKRIRELEGKVAAKYKEADKFQKKVDAMLDKLGPNPQKWVQDGTIFNFEDGVRFDAQTQDLIFVPEDGNQEVVISLLSASLTLQGSQKDEVQMLASHTTAPIYKEETVDLVADSGKTTFYFKPDDFQPRLAINTPERCQMNRLQELLRDSNLHVTIYLDHIPLSEPLVNTYANRANESLSPLTPMAKQRYSKLNWKINDKNLSITIQGSTDGVATRLSGLSVPIRHKLGLRNTEANYNYYLQVLRAMTLLYLVDTDIYIGDVKHNYEFDDKTMESLWEIINKASLPN